MNFPTHRFVLSLAAATAVSACGSEKSGSQSRDPTTIEVPQSVSEEQFASLAAEIGCYVVKPCCQDAGRTYEAAVCQAGFPAAFGMAPASSERFDSAAARDCLKALQQGGFDCGTVPDVCHQVYVGDVPVGGACTGDSDCEVTAGQAVSCDLEHDSKCKVTTLGALGDPCDQTCTAQGVSCHDTFFGTQSSYGNSAIAANHHVACVRADGLYCDAQTAQCVAVLNADSPCTDGDQCPDGSMCLDTCQAYIALGEPCTTGGTLCVQEAYCDQDGTCHAWRTKLDGAACTLSAECVGSCSDGLCTGAATAGGLTGAMADSVCSSL